MIHFEGLIDGFIKLISDRDVETGSFEAQVKTAAAAE